MKFVFRYDLFRIKEYSRISLISSWWLKSLSWGWKYRFIADWRYLIPLVSLLTKWVFFSWVFLLNILLLFRCQSAQSNFLSFISIIDNLNISCLRYFHSALSFAIYFWHERKRGDKTMRIVLFVLNMLNYFELGF